MKSGNLPALLLILCSSFSASYHKVENGDIGYTFIRKEKNISLSSRNIPAADDRTTRELRADFSVSACPGAVVNVLRNTSLCEDWMKGVTEVTDLRKISDNEWITYILYDIPWPLSNQDCIVHYRASMSTDGMSYQLKISGEPEYIPVRSGVERISHLSGYWKITGDGKGKSRVEYRIYSLQKPRFPRWATDPLIQQNLIETLASLRELTEKQAKTMRP